MLRLWSRCARGRTFPAHCRRHTASVGSFAGLRTDVEFTQSSTFERASAPIRVLRLLGEDGQLVAGAELPFSYDDAVSMYRTMVRLSEIDGILNSLQRQGRISFYMTGTGEEAAQVGTAAAMDFTDMVWPQYRELGAFLQRGFTIQQVVDQCLGKKDEPGKGRQMPVHYCAAELNMQAVTSPLGTQIPQAVGAGYAFRVVQAAAPRGCLAHLCRRGLGDPYAWTIQPPALLVPEVAMSECSWIKAVLEGSTECSSVRWAVISGFIVIVLVMVCCATLSLWFIYNRLLKGASGTGVGRAKSDLEEQRMDNFPHTSPTEDARSGEMSWAVCREDEWDPEPPNETDAIPILLSVFSPNNQTSCTGEYELVQGERPNGQPFWVKRGGDRWLYSGTDGRWYIGGQRSKDRKFACNTGFIYCNQFHKSRPPNIFTGGWESGHGETWTKDPNILVTAVRFPAVKEVCVWADEGSLPPAVLKDSAAFSPSSLPVPPLKLKDLQEDGPGAYLIIHDQTAVSAGVLLSDPVIDFLDAGLVVTVKEVTKCEEHSRVRGHIEKPDGWISLESLEDGYRWARRQSPAEESTEASSGCQRMNTNSVCSDGSSDVGSILDRIIPPMVATTPWSTPGHAPDMRLRAVDPPDARPLPPKDPPVALFVHSPNGQLSCAGVYELVPDEWPNDQALWKQQDASHWLYAGKNGRWCIAGMDVKEEGFRRSAGFISQTKIHRDLLPNEYSTPWQRWDKGKFVQDLDIRISVARAKNSHTIGIPPSPSTSTSPVLPPPRVRRARQQTPRSHTAATSASLGVCKRAEDTSSAAVSSTPSGSLEVALECIQAVGVEVATRGHLQRCISKAITPVFPWRIGPGLQPQIFSGLPTKEGLPDNVFELAWKPPNLYLTRPAPGLLLLNGEPVKQAWTPVRHGEEIGLCMYEGGPIQLAFQVLLEGNPPPAPRPLPAKPPGPEGEDGDSRQTVMDLRGCGLSAEGKSIVQASRAEMLRVIV